MSYNTYMQNKQFCNKNINYLTGPQGAMGPQGATGPKGIIGSIGPQGATGPQGACCVGAQGAQGAQGFIGPGGGPIGHTGATGPAGNGYVINKIHPIAGTDTLRIRSNLTTEADSFLFTNLVGSGSLTHWALSWGISEPGFSDITNEFFITFIDNTTTTEYTPFIYNIGNPYKLNTNGTNTYGSANDYISLNGSSPYNVNIYQSSTTNAGDTPIYNISVTLTRI
jgi:hypothetical protein